MRTICRSRRSQRGAMMIMLTLMLMTVLIPLTGLAIDLTLMYIVQAKLWETVDGAGLAAGRLIGTTSESIATLAQQVCQANFPTGYLGSSSMTCTTSYTVGDAGAGYPFYVTVTGRATEPTLFLKIFQVSDAVVTATAQVTRRMARIEIVLDRSGSMSGEIGSLKTTVASFVSGFTEGYDEMGLVVFGASGVVAYPTQNVGPYDFNPLHYNNPNASTGPDTLFQAVNPGDPTSPTCCDMIYAISQINSNGHTNMSDALSLAYIELQKAHYRDLHRDGVDVRNNILVFFTDGVPNTISAYLNSPDAQGSAMTPAYGYPAVYPVPNVLSPGNSLWPTKIPYPIPATFTTTSKHGNLIQTITNSPCLYNPTNVLNAATNPNGVTTATVGVNQMIGGLGDSDDSNGSSNALGQLASLDVSYAGGANGNSWSMYYTRNDENDVVRDVPEPLRNCNTLGWSGWPANGNMNVVNTVLNPDYMDIQRIPSWDLYGNATTDLGQGHTVASAPSPFPTSTVYDGNTAGGLNVAGSVNSSAGNGAQLQIASWNAVDNAAFNLRSGVDTNSTPYNITVYTIGYTPNGGTDASLLMRVANDPLQKATYGSNLFSTSQRQGTYYEANDAAGVNQAFNKIKGLLLEISR